MKKIWTLSCVNIFLVICLTAMSAIGTTDSESIVVYGIGYPPIKAESKAQALLMARRAATLDAYRNALKISSDEASENRDDKSFYENFSGFMKDMKIISEEYVNDGGVIIKARISAHDIFLLRNDKKKGDDIPERQGGPHGVTIEEWYKIISGMVKFGNKIQ